MASARQIELLTNRMKAVAQDAMQEAMDAKVKETVRVAVAGYAVANEKQRQTHAEAARIEMEDLVATITKLEGTLAGFAEKEKEFATKLAEKDAVIAKLMEELEAAKDGAQEEAGPSVPKVIFRNVVREEEAASRKGKEAAAVVAQKQQPKQSARPKYLSYAQKAQEAKAKNWGMPTLTATSTAEERALVRKTLFSDPRANLPPREKTEEIKNLYVRPRIFSRAYHENKFHVLRQAMLAIEAPFVEEISFIGKNGSVVELFIDAKKYDALKAVMVRENWLAADFNPIAPPPHASEQSVEIATSQFVARRVRMHERARWPLMAQAAFNDCNEAQSSAIKSALSTRAAKRDPQQRAKRTVEVDAEGYQRVGGGRGGRATAGGVDPVVEGAPAVAAEGGVAVIDGVPAVVAEGGAAENSEDENAMVITQ